MTSSANPQGTIYNDDITGSNGVSNTIDGLAGNDIIWGEILADTLSGSGGEDTLVGADGNDWLFGGDDNDALYGGNDNDLLEGGSGNDFLQGGYGDDRLKGQAGNDLLCGDLGNDFIEGDAGQDSIYGDSGDDTAVGGDDNDFIMGGDGRDALYGGNDQDTLVGDNGNDFLQGGYGDDALYGGNDQDTLVGDNGNDFLQGGYGDDNLEGDNGNDDLVGDNGNDTLNGGNGHDTLSGGAGADSFLFRTGVKFNADIGIDRITDFNTSEGDFIHLSKTTFTALQSFDGKSFSNPNDFAVVTNNSAAEASSAVIIYNSTTGELFYNTNGTNSGFGEGGKFAVLDGCPPLTANSFSICDAGNNPNPNPKASLGDRIWLDTNKNGQQDAGENGVNNLVVTLLDGGADGKLGTADDVNSRTTTTDANGNYLFDNLTSGREYQVQFSKPADFTYTTANQGDDNGDSDADTSTGKSQVVTLASGENNRSVDAGLVKPNDPASLGDQIWLDTNKNGQQDTGENGVKDLLVTLLDGGADGKLGTADDVNSRTTTTDANGNYLFDNLASGREYQVQFSKPANFTYTTANQGNDDSDSDADTNTGKSQVVTLASGENNRSVDAGLVDGPDCGKIVGDSLNITEGTTKSFQVQLESAVTQDTLVTVQVANGTAVQADDTKVKEFLIDSNWKPNTYYQYGFNTGEWAQIYSAGGAYTLALEKWNNDPFISTAPTRNISSRTLQETLYKGTEALVNDFRILNSSGTVQNGNSFQVLVKAGQSTSESFQVNASKEVFIGGGNFGGFVSENTETFSLKVSKVGDISADPNCEVATVNILDVKANLSPIAIDLNGDGIQTIGVDRGVQFDLLNTGSKVTTGWISGQDGFLAVDANGNGQIDNRDELFGGGVGEGFTELATFDSNKDGVVNASDSLFGSLLIWQDANENGTTDAGELNNLSAFGISSLNTAYTNQFTSDGKGNILGEVSSAVTTEGKSLSMIDVYFQYQ